DRLVSSGFQFGKHQVLPVYGSKTGQKLEGSTKWYRVAYTHRSDGKTYFGYVHSAYVTLCEKFDYNSKEFSEFPKSYRPYLAALKAAHPSWSFVPLDTKKEWSAAVAEQATVSKEDGTLTSPSFIHKSYNAIYRSTKVVGGLDASKTLLDGGTMYCASEATVAFFLDPRNFLNEVDVFMFSAQGYNKKLHTLDSVENMIKGTYMEGLSTVNSTGKKISYAEAFLDAAKKTNISPYYLLITSFSENGTTGTGLSKGNLEGEVCKNAGCKNADEHKGYYNFFGIGSTPNGSPQHNGLEHAIEKGWDTAYKAIVGGAEFQKNGYIDAGQQTPYLKKFNVNPEAKNPNVWHQYMQNLAHPETEALLLFREMEEGGLLDLSHEFLIPVYDKMPETPSALPNVETYLPETGGGEDAEEEEAGEASYSTSYTLDTKNGFLYGVKPETSEATFKSKFKLGADTTISVSSSKIGTGTQVRILYREKEVESFYVVVRGDLSGNGKVEALDLLYLRDYLLKKKSFNTVLRRAADVDASAKTDSLDLLKLRDAILGIYTISQKG
ncbi:MAG: hypothetical protein II328_00330, partial [Clostridia bacterium]|nr:hypothetical protein [Clostridia bacterium]